MKGRLNKKKAKSIEIKCLAAPQGRKVAPSLPTHGKLLIGNKKAYVPYADHIEYIVSSETDRKPVRPMKTTNKRVKILSAILKKSGIESLKDLGEAIIYKI
jgi:hypothetical protein